MRRETNRYIFAPDVRYREKKGNRRYLLVLLLFVLLVVGVVDYIVVHQVKLEDRKVTVMNLPGDLESFSILHLSDLHGASLGEQQAAIRSVLGNRKTSCVVMTGDMLGDNEDTSALLALLELIPRDTPKFMIPGDSDGPFIDNTAHGSLSVYTDWAEELMAAGVVLLDEPYALTRNKSTIWFIPEELYTLELDDLEAVYRDHLKQMNERVTDLTADDAAKMRAMEYQLERIDHIRECKKQIGPEDIQVVLTHTPLQEDYVKDMIGWTGKEDFFSIRYASLILAGHYNGGQWRLPFIGAIHVPELGWFPGDDRVQGLSHLEAIPQYISPGLGSSVDYGWRKGRFFNSPTVTILTLTGKVV